jgi:hypothetical protein
MKINQRVVSMKLYMNTMRNSIIAKKFNMLIVAGLISMSFVTPSFAAATISYCKKSMQDDDNGKNLPFVYAKVDKALANDNEGIVDCVYGTYGKARQRDVSYSVKINNLNDLKSNAIWNYDRGEYYVFCNGDPGYGEQASPSKCPFVKKSL